jgi:hypothetical protein
MEWSRPEAHCFALAIPAYCIFILTTYIPAASLPAFLPRPRPVADRRARAAVPACSPALFFLDPNFPFDLVTKIFYKSVFSTAA